MRIRNHLILVGIATTALSPLIISTLQKQKGINILWIENWEQLSDKQKEHANVWIIDVEQFINAEKMTYQKTNATKTVVYFGKRKEHLLVKVPFVTTYTIFYAN